MEVANGGRGKKGRAGLKGCVPLSDAEEEKNDGPLGRGEKKREKGEAIGKKLKRILQRPIELATARVREGRGEGLSTPAGKLPPHAIWAACKIAAGGKNGKKKGGRERKGTSLFSSVTEDK